MKFAKIITLVARESFDEGKNRLLADLVEDNKESPTPQELIDLVRKYSFDEGKLEAVALLEGLKFTLTGTELVSLIKQMGFDEARGKTCVNFSSRVSSVTVEDVFQGLSIMSFDEGKLVWLESLVKFLPRLSDKEVDTLMSKFQFEETKALDILHQAGKISDEKFATKKRAREEDETNDTFDVSVNGTSFEMKRGSQRTFNTPTSVSEITIGEDGSVSTSQVSRGGGSQSIQGIKSKGGVKLSQTSLDGSATASCDNVRVRSGDIKCTSIGRGAHASCNGARADGGSISVMAIGEGVSQDLIDAVMRMRGGRR